MNMEFMILQGNTQSINSIDYKLACYQRERREVQADITTVTEQMQEFEDQTDYIISSYKTDAQNQFDLSIKNLQSNTNEAYQLQNDYKATYDGLAATTATLKENMEQLKVEKGETDPLYKEAFDKWKTAYEAEKKAKENYDLASKNYQTKSAENLEEQKTLNTRYQNQVNQIEEMKKTMKKEYEKDMKDNLKSLNNRDAKLELSINELNTMKEMYKSEKENAQQAVEQQAQDLAPKYS